MNNNMNAHSNSIVIHYVHNNNDKEIRVGVLFDLLEAEALPEPLVRFLQRLCVLCIYIYIYMSLYLYLSICIYAYIYI